MGNNLFRCDFRGRETISNIDDVTSPTSSTSNDVKGTSTSSRFSTGSTPRTPPSPGEEGSVEPAAGMLVLVTADEESCLHLLRTHVVDRKKLKKLLDGSVNQASALIEEYESTKTIPAALAKAFLNGIFSGTAAHTKEQDQRKLQIPPLLKMLNNKGHDPGQTPDHFINDIYLGDGNGVESRLAVVEKLKSRAGSALEMVNKVAHDRAPDILEGIAPGIKSTSALYTKVFAELDTSVMAKVEALVKELLSTAPGGGTAKTAQPTNNSTSDPQLSDPCHPLFMIGMLKDALHQKTRLDEFVALVASNINGAYFKLAPLKSVERAMAKVYEKYGCRFDQLTDLARATIEAANEQVLHMVLEELQRAVKRGDMIIHRIKHRLGADFDAMEAGGYRDILVNVTFPPSGHLVELQLNLKPFVDIKNGGGHASYSVGRMLQAFDPAATTYMGLATKDRVCDIKSGLIKKATLVGLDDKEEMEGSALEIILGKALGSPGVQLVELKFLNVAFSDAMQNLGWLATSAKELAPTLMILQINTCGVKGPIPSEVGELHHLTVLNLAGNELEGPIPSSLGKCTKLTGLSLSYNQLTGEIPVSLGNCTKLTHLHLFKNQLTDPQAAKASLKKKIPKCDIFV